MMEEEDSMEAPFQCVGVWRLEIGKSGAVVDSPLGAILTVGGASLISIPCS